MNGRSQNDNTHIDIGSAVRGLASNCDFMWIIGSSTVNFCQLNGQRGLMKITPYLRIVSFANVIELLIRDEIPLIENIP